MTQQDESVLCKSITVQMETTINSCTESIINSICMHLDYGKKSMQAQGKHANSTKEKCNETHNKKVLDI